MIDIFSILINKYNRKDIILEIIGPTENDEKESLLHKVKSESLDSNVFFYEKMSRTNLIRHITGSFMGISLIPPTKTYVSSSPVKAVEFLSLGIPVIGNREINDQRMVIENSKGGITVPYHSSIISKILNSILDREDLVIKMGKRGHKWIKENRLYSQYALIVRRTYNKLFDKK